MKQELTPLEVCMRLIGPLGVLAEVIGYGPTAPYLWERPSRTRAAGHFPSTLIMQRLLAHSAANGLGLTAEHLIWGADETEIEEILAQRDASAPAFTSRRERAA